MSQEYLRKLWKEFGDIPVDEDDNIEEDFICGDITFTKGTDRLEIWHYFDEQFNVGLFNEIFR